MGIDPAWTIARPSGEALITRDGDAWRCRALAPSYKSSLDLAEGRAVDWGRPLAGGPPDPGRLLDASH